MGVTGSSSSSTLSASLPELCARVRKFAGNTPIAVGFGVNTREHFLSVGGMADGVVIGSKIVTLIKEAPAGKAQEAIKAYCQEVIRPRTDHEQKGVSHDIGLGEALDNAKVETEATPTATISRPDDQADGFVEQLESIKTNSTNGTHSYEVCVIVLACFLQHRNCLLGSANLEANTYRSRCLTALLSSKRPLSLPSMIQLSGKSSVHTILI